MCTVLLLTDVLLEIKTVLFDMDALLTGLGADGQRTGPRDGQTGHPGRDRKPAKANAEVCEPIFPPTDCIDLSNPALMPTSRQRFMSVNPSLFCFQSTHHNEL